MQAIDFEQVLEKILDKDSRYHRDAYLFVRDALDHTQKLVCKKDKGRLRHVTGQELLDGIRQFALATYGPMTLLLLEEWGIRRCEDFGEIVFNMVEWGLLNKTDSDSREDFRGGYRFCEAFRNPFLPPSKLAEQPTRAEPSEV